MKPTFVIAAAAAAAALLAGCCQKCGKGDACTAEACDSRNEVIETILTRRSMRAYSPEAVDRTQMQTIVECGLNAPSGLNMQPWAVRVVDSEEFIGGMTALYRERHPETDGDVSFRNMFRNAPTVVFIASPDDGSGVFDCGLLAENMMLAAWSMGIGSCCLGSAIGFIASTPETAPFIERLSLPEGYRPLIAIGFGYPDEQPESRERDMSKAMFVD